MCGILGMLPSTNDQNNFLNALNTLAHRGPDDCGVYHDENISLGHRRLAIVDLSKLGHQPMTYKSLGGGDIVLSLMERYIIF